MLDNLVRISTLTLQLLSNQPNLPSEQVQYREKPIYAAQVDGKTPIEKLLSEGEKYLDDRKFDKAIASYNALMQLSPKGQARIKTLHGLCKAYFEKAENIQFDAPVDSTGYYTKVVTNCNKLLELPSDLSIKRDALLYSAMAYWYGLSEKHKNPKEAEKRLDDALSYSRQGNMKDDVMEFIMFQLGRVPFENAEFDDRFKIDSSESAFKSLIEEFPNGNFFTDAKERLSKIPEIRAIIEANKKYKKTK